MSLTCKRCENAPQVCTCVTEEYQYCLKWDGKEDTPKIRAAMERCKFIIMFENAEPRFVDHDEYKTLVKDGVISKPESYWEVREGEIGLITRENFGSSDQWQMVSNCKADFLAGWAAAQRTP